MDLNFLAQALSKIAQGAQPGAMPAGGQPSVATPGINPNAPAPSAPQPAPQGMPTANPQDTVPLEHIQNMLMGGGPPKQLFNPGRVEAQALAAAMGDPNNYQKVLKNAQQEERLRSGMLYDIKDKERAAALAQQQEDRLAEEGKVGMELERVQIEKLKKEMKKAKYANDPQLNALKSISENNDTIAKISMALQQKFGPQFQSMTPQQVTREALKIAAAKGWTLNKPSAAAPKGGNFKIFESPDGSDHVSLDMNDPNSVLRAQQYTSKGWLPVNPSKKGLPGPGQWKQTDVMTYIKDIKSDLPYQDAEKMAALADRVATARGKKTGAAGAVLHRAFAQSNELANSVVRESEIALQGNPALLEQAKKVIDKTIAGQPLTDTEEAQLLQVFDAIVEKAKNKWDLERNRAISVLTEDAGLDLKSADRRLPKPFQGYKSPAKSALEKLPPGTTDNGDGTFTLPNGRKVQPK